MSTCVVDEKDVDLVIEGGLWHSRGETGKERVGKREKKGESGLREKSVFLLFS